MNGWLREVAFETNEDAESLINISILYRRELYELQSKLAAACLKYSVQEEDGNPRKRSKLLREYGMNAIEMNFIDITYQLTFHRWNIIVQALRDWNYIQQCAHSRDDPFHISSKTSVGQAQIRAAVRAVEGQISTDALSRIKDSAPGITNPQLWEARSKDNLVSDLFGGTRLQHKKRLDFKRFGMAMLGGVFLICPMLIMVFNPTLLATLLTTCLSVLLLGLVLPFMVESGFDILSGTAAYAAVLVVFIGTSTSITAIE